MARQKNEQQINKPNVFENDTISKTESYSLSELEIPEMVKDLDFSGNTNSEEFPEKRPGRPRISDSEKKKQFSVGATVAQHNMYKRAAKLENRSFSDFINNALSEYLKRHNLLP